jgi:hypothetical protein
VPSEKFESESYSSSDAFGAPEPLYRPPSPAERYSVEALGPTLGQMATALQEATGAPLPLCGSSTLATAACSVQPHGDVVVDGRISPLSLFIGSVAESGERKTTIDRGAGRAHASYQKEQWDVYAKAKVSHDIRSAVYRAERDAILRKKGPTAEEKQIALGLLVVPEPLRRPCMLIENTTIEALLKHLREDLPSIGVFSSEGGMFLGGYSMQKEQLTHTIATLSRLWDGDAVARHTVGDFDDAIPMYGRRMSAHFMIQPDIATKLLGDKEIQSQGLLSRFIISWPDSTIGTRLERGRERLDENQHARDYWNSMKSIISAKLPMKDIVSGELTPRQLRLSSKAYGIWKAFEEGVERRMAVGKDLEHLRAFCNKAGENCARIAGLLTLVKNLTAHGIAAPEMDAATQLMTFHVNEIVRSFCQGTIGPDLKEAEVVFKWIKSKELRYVYPEQVYRFGPSGFRTKKKAVDALTALEQHSHLVKLAGPKKLDEKMRRDVWQVITDQGRTQDEE